MACKPGLWMHDEFQFHIISRNEDGSGGLKLLGLVLR